MAITLNTSAGPVILKEMFEGYEPGMDIQRGPFVKKLYLCPSWAVAFACVNGLVGTGGRPIQHACPESPNLRCMSAVIQPRGEYDIRDGGRPQFNLPVIEATYAVPTWEAQVGDDPTGSQSFPNEAQPGQPYLFMEQSIDWDSDLVKLPGRAYKFQTVPQLVNDTPVAIPVPTAIFTLIRRWQTTLPWQNCTSYIKSLNSTTFLGQPMGLVMLLKMRTRKQFQSDGTRSQEIEMSFKWRKYDHNAFLRGDTGQPDILVNSLGTFPFTYSDLNALLV